MRTPRTPWTLLRGHAGAHDYEPDAVKDPEEPNDPKTPQDPDHPLPPR